MSSTLRTALLDAAADVVKIVTVWMIAALSIQGVLFTSLITQKALVSLTLALAAYLGAWAARYRQTGDPTPPEPAAASRLSVSDLNTILEGVTHHMQAVSVADCQRISTAVVLALTPLIRPPLPQAPPAAPPAVTVP